MDDTLAYALIGAPVLFALLLGGGRKVRKRRSVKRSGAKKTGVRTGSTGKKYYVSSSGKRYLVGSPAYKQVMAATRRLKAARAKRKKK